MNGRVGIMPGVGDLSALLKWALSAQVSQPHTDVIFLEKIFEKATSTKTTKRTLWKNDNGRFDTVSREALSSGFPVRHKPSCTATEDG